MLHATISEDEVRGTAVNSTRLLTVLEESGFQEMFWGFPMVLLTAAKYRQTSVERAADRVYGIMQVFDLQLGISAPCVSRSRKFELPELQDQLGGGLLEKYPIMSQLHTHSEPAPFGKAWRLGESSIVPGLTRLVYHEMTIKGNLESYSELSNTTIDDIMWGFFKGFSTSVQSLQLAWGGQNIPSIRNVADELYIALDTMDPTEFPALVAVPQYYWSLNQVDMAAHLACSCPTLRVLLLAVFLEQSITDKDRRPKRAFGLLLMPEGEEYGQQRLWRRVGICLWTVRDSDYEEFKHSRTKKDTFKGMHGEEWCYMEGPFG